MLQSAARTCPTLVDRQVLRYYALNGTDHRGQTEQDTAIGAYIRWHNQHARPKRAFAPDSKIRHPAYPMKAA